MKQKSENKNTTNEYRYFLESNFLGVHRLFDWDYLNAEKDAKRYSAKNIICQKV